MLLLDAVLAASALFGAVDGLPDPLRPGLLLRANDLVLTATHLRNIEAERQAADSRGRCDHWIKVKKPFRRLLPKLVHPDCRLRAYSRGRWIH